MPPRFASFLPAPLPLRDGVQVLEIGTGDGSTILQVATWARELGVRGHFIGLDREPARAQPFAERAAAAGVGEMTRFECHDAFRIASPSGPFDLLLCFDCLSQFVFEGLPAGHDPDSARDRLTALLAHWRTLLSPGGLLVIAETDRDAAGDSHARGIALFEQERWPLLPSELLDAALRTAGFGTLLSRSSVRQQCGSRDEMEQSMGAGAYRRLPRGNFPPPPFPPRIPQVADGIHELAWRVVQASPAPPADQPSEP